jgi:hypothetical protein
MAHAARLDPSVVLLDPVAVEWDSARVAGEGTVRGLAREIRRKNAFALLPILADALEDSGCPDGHLLDHLRSGLPHQERCWVVDILLGREPDFVI